MNQHRLVISHSEIQKDYEDQEDPRRQLCYQMTRLTKDRGSLQHDDRIDVLAMGVNYWTEQINADREKSYDLKKSKVLEDSVRNFMVTGLGLQTPQDDLWAKVR